MAEMQITKKRKREQDDARPAAPRPQAPQRKKQANAPSPSKKWPAKPTPDPQAKAKVASNDDATLRSLGKRKAFKHTMDSPHTVKWAHVPDDLVKQIMTALTEALRPWGAAKQMNRDLKKAERRRLKEAKEAEKTDLELSNTDLKPDPEATDLPQLFIGINGVTRHLQKTIRTGQTPDIDCVFLCRQDANPPHLYAHFPVLCQLAKRRASDDSQPESIPLIPLPKGSEKRLAEVLKLKRVVVVGVKKSALNTALFDLVSKIEVPSISWLPQPAADGKAVYAGLQMKTIETTAPLVTKKQQKKEQKLKEMGGKEQGGKKDGQKQPGKK